MARFLAMLGALALAAASPPLAADRADEREAMVLTAANLAATGGVRRIDRRVLEAMRAVPRHAFVPEQRRSEAYDDSPVPIGHGHYFAPQHYINAWVAVTAPDVATVSSSGWAAK